VPPSIKQQLLALNCEYLMTDHIVSCFATMFHWEAWARILDYIIGTWWNQDNKNKFQPKILLISIAI
jgi:hypothetical protein